MSKEWLGNIGVEIDKCDICGGAQSVEKCPICGKDYCWGCGEYVYDKKNPTDYTISICCDCAKDTYRFVNECPIHKCVCGEEIDTNKPYVVDNGQYFHVECYTKSK